MAFVPDVPRHVPLTDYGAFPQLAAAVQALQHDTRECVQRLRGRTIWMLNSTATGGGVAELLSAQIALLCDLGVDVRWVVLEAAESDFFTFTKRLHNMIHGAPGAAPTADEQALYEAVSRDNADQIKSFLKPQDILVVHDPQPLLTGAILKKEMRIRAVWRCHIGLDEDSAHAQAVWSFLRPHIEAYDHTVFSLPEYAPDFVRDRVSIIHPTIDPLSHKNRELSLHKLVGILCDSGLSVPYWPLLEQPFAAPARRLQDHGGFAIAVQPNDIGLVARPIITQVSRWDKLKGFAPLLDAFALLKRTSPKRKMRDERHRRTTQLVRLILAGPDPDAIQDDPESVEVVEELKQKFLALDQRLRTEIVILALPMQSRKHNALMVNALQRSSDIVVQNSLREGFGLTVAEAMWKQTPILGSVRATGVRLQVRDHIDGRLVPDPESVEELADVLHEMLADPVQLEAWGRNAQRRVYDEFLIFRELRQWLQLLADLG